MNHLIKDDNSKEIELKYRLNSPLVGRQILQDELIQRLSQNSEAKVRNYITTYYDTEDCRLLNERLCYRIRERNGNYIASIKGMGSTKGGLAVRHEWELKTAENKATIDAFSDSPIGAELARIAGDKPLYPLFATRFQRSTLDLHIPNGTVVELAVDIGEIAAGEKTEPICELELELKSGSLEEMLGLGEELVQRYSLQTEGRSKFLRGLMLIGRKHKY